MTERLTWASPSLTVEFDLTADSFPRLIVVRGTGGVEARFERDLPLVEIVTAALGHVPANDRLVGTKLSAQLRYESHEIEDGIGVSTLVLRMLAKEAGIAVDLRLESPDGIAVLQSSVTVRNVGTAGDLNLRSVTSWVSSFGYSGASAGPDFDDWRLFSGRSDWLAEGRWSNDVLRGETFPRLAQQLTGHNPRSAHTVVSTGSWSTGKHLPVAGVASVAQGLAWVWQVEHNGAWHWEVGENTTDGYFALSGPTETDHNWFVRLAPGQSFTTVPVAVALGADLTAAIAQLTAYRRVSRRAHSDNETMGVVFNDYMNTLNGDPTTEKLLPLIDAAAASGAEIFCIDAGWYDDSGHWWDSVGEWLPSTTRFPGGLDKVIAHIQSLGMVAGLWLEPEVVGVKSPAAQSLPAEAFLQRNGARIMEHERYHLDLRHPDAIAHLNAVVDRLIADFGVGFFKLDYNINPGAGTDVDADSTGAGLLEHNRAHLAWLDSVLDRHPSLILENCGSGAMRMDFAMLSRLQLQSTSDQQDFLKYPPIAAAAPVSMLPEQAASWAYPQPSMSDEEVAFCLVTGLLGRIYVSGYLNVMSEEQRATVAEAIVAHKALRGAIAHATPFWPLGLPLWESPWVALGLNTGESRLISIWNRSAEDSATTLKFPDLVGSKVTVRTVFPRQLTEWSSTWNPATGTLEITNPTSLVGARTIELVTSS